MQVRILYFAGLSARPCQTAGETVQLPGAGRHRRGAASLAGRPRRAVRARRWAPAGRCACRSNRRWPGRNAADRKERKWHSSRRSPEADHAGTRAAGRFRLRRGDSLLRNGDGRVGAVASFIGTVRDINDGDGVATMTLEHYPGMTEKSLEADLRRRHGRAGTSLDTLVIHRYGELRADRPDRAGGGDLRPPRRCLCRLRVHHGLPQDGSAILEEGDDAAGDALGRGEDHGRRSGRAAGAADEPRGDSAAGLAGRVSPGRDRGRRCRRRARRLAALGAEPAAQSPSIRISPSEPGRPTCWAGC